MAVAKRKTKKANTGGWKFSIVESLNYGFAKTKKFFWITLGIFILIEVILKGIINGVSGSETLGSLFGDAAGLWFLVAGLFSMYVSIMISIGWLKMFLAVLAGKAPALAYFMDINDSHKYFWSYIFASILLGLIVFGGFILLIIPGFVWALTYGLAPILVIDKKLSPPKALAMSRKLMTGQRLNLFVWGLAMFGIHIVGMLCFVIGLIFTIPLSYYAYAYVYAKLAGKPIK